MKNKQGFTLVELLVVIAIIALLIGLLLPALAKAQANAKSLKDKNQITQIHKAAIGWSSENKGKLPTPGWARRLPDTILGLIPGSGPEDFTMNTTAYVYSLMLAQNLFSPEILIGTTEVNANIVQDQDYNYNAYKPISNMYWDSAFSANLTAPNCNVSYSSAAMCGQRKKVQWKDTQNAGYAVFGTRATRGGPGGFGGATTGTDYEGSPTLLLHGPKKQWNGHVCFADNHSETLDSFYAPLCTYQRTNNWSTNKDNIYQAEFNDIDTANTQASGDSYLGFFSAITLNAAAPPQPVSATPVFDPQP